MRRYQFKNAVGNFNRDLRTSRTSGKDSVNTDTVLKGTIYQEDK